MSNSLPKRILVPAALVVGGVTAGSLFAPIGLASAQSDEATDVDLEESDGGESESESDTESESGDADGDKARGHRHHRGAKAEVLEEILGLSAEEIRDAMQDGNSLAAVAEGQGISEAELTDALVAAATERIDEAVADGTIDAERAEERKAGLADRVAEMIQRVPSEDGSGRGHRHGGIGRGLKGGLDGATEALGLTAEEIRDGFADGKTLADLAEEQGVSTEDLAAAMVADAMERIDDAVEDGRIDEDRAAEAKASLEEMIDRAIEAEPFALGRGVGRAEGRAHHRGHHRHDRADSSADDGEVVESSLTDA